MRYFTSFFIVVFSLIIEGRAQTWSMQVSGTSQQLYAVYNNIVAGAFGTVVKSGGIFSTTWTSQNIGSTQTLHGIHFLNENSGTGFIVGDSGLILKTSNRTNWSTQASGINSPLYSVFFANANIGYAVGANNTILKTSNGGTTWVLQASGITGGSYNLYSVFFIDSSIGFISGDNGYILKTINGGAIWTKLQPNGSNITANALYSIAWTDANTGYAVGSLGSIFKTVNGGTVWNALSSGTTNTLNSIRFTEPKIGYVVGNGGVILKTINGTTWASQISGTTRNLRGVHFWGACLTEGCTYYWYAVGDSGTILKNSGVSEIYLSEPFNGRVGVTKDGNLRYLLPHRTQVQASLFDIQGKLFLPLLNSVQASGSYDLPLPTTKIPYGAYILDFHAGEYHKAVKISR